MDFPPSAVPFALLAVAVAVDLAFLLGRLPDIVRPLVGAVLVGAAAAGGLWLQQEWLVAPPVDVASLLTGTLVLAAAWIGAVLLVRSARFRRWARAH